KEAQLPLHLELPREELVEVPYEEALNRRIVQIVGTFTDALILAKDNIGTAQQVQEERSKRIEKASTFKEGDLVILYDAAKQNVHGDKFTLRWTGPYYIHKKIGDKTVILRDKADPDKLIKGFILRISENIEEINIQLKPEMFKITTAEQAIEVPIET
ncbi:10050_t:CDS:2, partial [Diversispora eburnea]